MDVGSSTITANQTGQFVIQTNPETVCHAVSYLRELCSSCYPFLLTQENFYFSDYLNLTKQHCYKFLGDCFDTINQGYLIAESLKEINHIDLFLSNEEFEKRVKNYSLNYGNYSLLVDQIHNLFKEEYVPNLSNDFVNNWLELDETNLYYKIKLEKIKNESFELIVKPIEAICEILNKLCSSQSLYIACVMLTVNKTFAMLFVELARISDSKYKEFGIIPIQYQNIKQFANRILVFYRTIFSSFLLNQSQISLIHQYMQDF